MNYFILENKRFQTKVAIFDSEYNTMIGVLIKYGILSKCYFTMAKDSFLIRFIKVKNKDMDRFKEAMKIVYDINTKLYQDQYTNMCNEARTLLSYEQFQKENN